MSYVFRFVGRSCGVLNVFLTRKQKGVSKISPVHSCVEVPHVFVSRQQKLALFKSGKSGLLPPHLNNKTDDTYKDAQQNSILREIANASNRLCLWMSTMTHICNILTMEYEMGVQGMEYGIWNLESGMWTMVYGV